MRLRTSVSAVVLIFTLWSALFAFQRGQFGRRRFGDEEALVTPPDADEKTEWAFARLQYPSVRGSYNWTIDYPAADRHFVQGVRRLTRLHTRSVEQVVPIDTNEIYDWPWVYAVEVGYWDLTDDQCKKMRDYLNRGGFLMVDDFHGTREWEGFMRTLSRIFPDRPVVDLENVDAIFHTLYDLNDKVQVPGIAALRSGVTYEKDGIEPKWRGVVDNNGRIQVAICHNMDLGDAWEHADAPWYPEKMTSLAYRIGINYIVYSMTH